MATFSRLFTVGGAIVPQEKIHEYEQLLEKLFQSGGMMEELVVSKYDINILALRKASMHEEGMNFQYNYFEDNSWENVLYDRESMLLYSENIGWSEFCTVVNSAYILETLYLSGSAVAIEGDVVVDPRPATRWISWLSDKPIPGKGTGPWDLYEMLKHTKSFMANVEWETAKDYIAYYADDKAGYKEWLSVLAVQGGTLSAEYKMERKTSEKEFIDISVNNVRSLLHQFHSLRSGDGNSRQEAQLLELLRNYYGTDMNGKEFEKQCKETGIARFGEIVAALDMPQIIVMLIAEEYDFDFWELWNTVSDDVKKGGKHYSADKWEEPPQPISTVKFLNVREDSMIPYWNGSDGIQFSAELETWFAEMKEKYDYSMGSGREYGGQDPVLWVMKLVEYAASEYANVYVFYDFLDETIDHINDRRYLSLWAVYEDMLYDPVMQKTGSVVFQDRDYINGWRSWWQTRRPLKDWRFLEPEEKWNKARVTLRNYMALVGNQKLREKVFGF